MGHAFQVEANRKSRRISLFRSSFAGAFLLGVCGAGFLLWSAPAAAQEDEMMNEFVSQFRENIDQVRIILQDIDRERNGDKKLAGKRDALERLSRAYIILQRIPAKVQESEDLGEARRYMDSTIKDLGSDPLIKKARDSILAKAIESYRAGNYQESLGLFEELRLMDPANAGVTFLVRHLGKKLDEAEEK